jgi:hypothetical protein
MVPNQPSLDLRLVGMTRSELQAAVGLRFNDGANIAYFLPQDIIDNTIRAFNTSATAASGTPSKEHDELSPAYGVV